MTIAEEIQRRGITEVLHFTTERGIVGTLAKQALLSRYRLPKESYLQHILHVNSQTRPETSEFFDKSANWLDFINLSISEINRRFFDVSQRWHQVSNVWWGILAFDPIVMTHPDVYFATTNNAYDLCSRQNGLSGLSALFKPLVRRKSPSWVVYRNNRPAHLPTCEQAEVLYPGELSTDFLRRIYVQNDNFNDITCGWLKEFGLKSVEVVTSTEKFRGQPN